MKPLPKPPLAPAPPLVLPEGCDEVLHLIGSTRLGDFLSFAREQADLSAARTGRGEAVTLIDLAETWRDAATIYEKLGKHDPYPAQVPEVFPLPDGMRRHCDELLSKAHIQREFNLVPVALGMVPLAHVIAMQPRINMATARSVKFADGSLSDEALAAMCLPLDAPPHSLRVLEQNSGGVTFTADNHDVRFLIAQVVPGSAVTLSGRGHIDQVLALPVGFSSNVLNVVRFKDRLVLNNGYHRALALWKRGVLHAPAIIHVCRHWEDVALAGASEIYDNAPVYFERARPPLLKDFVDRRLCVSLAVVRARKYVRIRYQVETGYLRD